MGAIFRSVLYPAYHGLKRDGFNCARRELERNQRLPTEEVLDLQQERLSRLLLFARDNVPYYRARLHEFEFQKGTAVSSRVFCRIPLLTKDAIRREGDALVSDDLTGNSLVPNSTSGSTGEAIRFYTDSRSVSRREAAVIRSDGWAGGWRLGDRYVRLWGSPIDLKQAARMRARLRGLIAGARVFSSYELSASKMDEYIDTIRRFQPVLFIAYPGPLEQFAIHCSTRGAAFPSLRGIVSSAETLWPQQREVIEEAFGTKVFDRYGSREVGQIASECEMHDGLHISADRLLLEIIDDEGQPCPPGAAGRIVVTDLDNYGMPLIRYEIGDHGVLADRKSCSCGRGLPLLQKVVGRTMDIVRTPDGRKLGGTFWTLLLKARPGLKQIQVVQEQLDGVIINFVRDDGFDVAVLDYFVEKIREYCGSDFEVKFVERESIALTKSGKQRLVVSALSN